MGLVFILVKCVFSSWSYCWGVRIFKALVGLLFLVVSFIMSNPFGVMSFDNRGVVWCMMVLSVKCWSTR